MTDPIPLSAVHAVCGAHRGYSLTLLACVRCPADTGCFAHQQDVVKKAITALRAAGWTVEAGNSVTRSSADSMEGET